MDRRGIAIELNPSQPDRYNRPSLPDVSEYYDLNLQFRHPAEYIVEITWTSEFASLKQKIKVFVVPVVHDMQLRQAGLDFKVDANVGDLVRVTLDENPTTGYVTHHNAKKKHESKSLSDKPFEEHLIEFNSYYQRYIDLKTRYEGGIAGLGGCRIMTFGITAPGKHTLLFGFARSWEPRMIPAYTIVIDASE